MIVNIKTVSPGVYVSATSGYSEYWAQPGLSHPAWGTSNQRQNKEGPGWADDAEGKNLRAGKWAAI